jgi:hypothetical protein
MSDDRVYIFVIYDHPSDFPNKFVLRRQWATRDGAIHADDGCYTADSIEPLRQMMIERGAIQMPLFEGEDPAIAETWM